MVLVEKEEKKAKVTEESVWVKGKRECERGKRDGRVRGSVREEVGVDREI